MLYYHGEMVYLIEARHNRENFGGRNLMRVLIMSDMEGVSGIVVWDQVNGGAPMYEERRRLYTDDLSTVDTAAPFRGRHGVEIVEPLKVISREKDWMEAWNQIWHY
jgi:hypothetical protein